MKHLYLFTLEIAPLEVDRTYDELPSHLTLMSRFVSDLSPDELVSAIRPLFAETTPVHLAFDETIRLGPKKVTAHMLTSSDERHLHVALRKCLDDVKVEYQYPEFIGENHKPHVTKREGMQFAPGSSRVAPATYLIEVVDKKRVVRHRFKLNDTSNNQ